MLMENKANSGKCGVRRFCFGFVVCTYAFVMCYCFNFVVLSCGFDVKISNTVISMSKSARSQNISAIVPVGEKTRRAYRDPVLAQVPCPNVPVSSAGTAHQSLQNCLSA